MYFSSIVYYVALRLAKVVQLRPLFFYIIHSLFIFTVIFHVTVLIERFTHDAEPCQCTSQLTHRVLVPDRRRVLPPLVDHSDNHRSDLHPPPKVKTARNRQPTALQKSPAQHLDLDLSQHPGQSG
jgi:hypothetical protein